MLILIVAVADLCISLGMWSYYTYRYARYVKSTKVLVKPFKHSMEEMDYANEWAYDIDQELWPRTYFGVDTDVIVSDDIGVPCQVEYARACLSVIAKWFIAASIGRAVRLKSTTGSESLKTHIYVGIGVHIVFVIFNTMFEFLGNTVMIVCGVYNILACISIGVLGVLYKPPQVMGQGQRPHDNEHLDLEQDEQFDTLSQMLEQEDMDGHDEPEPDPETRSLASMESGGEENPGPVKAKAPHGKKKIPKLHAKPTRKMIKQPESHSKFSR